MIRTLWLKKIWKGLSKGVSSVIGTVFLILVVFAIATNVFLWTISQSSIYNQAAKDVNQKNADRLNENVVVTEGNCTYDVPSGKVKVQAKLTNAGSVAAQIINLWVFDTSPSKQTYNFDNSIASMSESNLNPGQVLDFTGTKARMVTVPSASPGDNFNAWFVTARGNTVPVAVTEGIIVAQLSQGIGSIALDFGKFTYFKYATDTKLANYPNGTKSFNVPGSNTYIAFGAFLTNLDPSKQTITFNVTSNVWLMFPGAPGQTPQWYVVNVASDGTIAPTYSPISLTYTETKLIVFASSKPVTAVGEFSRNSISPSITPNPCALNLLLLGTIEARDYGQNIPFVSLYVYKP